MSFFEELKESEADSEKLVSTASQEAAGIIEHAEEKAQEILSMGNQRLEEERRETIAQQKEVLKKLYRETLIEGKKEQEALERKARARIPHAVTQILKEI